MGTRDGTRFKIKWLLHDHRHRRFDGQMQLILLAIDGAPESILIPRQLPQQGNAFPVGRVHVPYYERGP